MYIVCLYVRPSGMYDVQLEGIHVRELNDYHAWYYHICMYACAYVRTRTEFLRVSFSPPFAPLLSLSSSSISRRLQSRGLGQ